MLRPDNLILADKTKLDPLLVSLLNKCTPHGFEHHIVKIIDKLPYIQTNVTKRLYDKEMLNRIFIVGDSSSVFSCHMDIIGNVGKTNSDNGTTDTIFLMEDRSAPTRFGMYYGAKGMLNDKDVIDKYTGCPVGADDKLGVYILLKMIEAKIPGMYIFHTGEECGGRGSASLAAKHPHLFKDKLRAIAFDRANYGDVINFQRGSRCCSKEFGESLAEAFNPLMPPQQKFKSEVHGTFTDTASYTKLIPECTNVSVGYFNQHGPEEHFDYLWLNHHLLPAILKIDYEKLPVKRDPKVVDYNSGYGQGYNYNTKWKGNNVVNFKKVSWKDATPITPYNEFPLWDYTLGFIEEADPEVLKMAISRNLGILTWGAKKDEFVAWFCDHLAHNKLLQEENTALQITLDKLTGVYEEPIITAHEDKVQLLTKLVVLSSQAVLYGDYQKWCNNYIEGAKKLLEKPKPRPVKLNRIIFALATLIDCSEIHPPEMEAVLNEVDAYIAKHADEDGFVVNKKMPVKPPKEITYTPQENYSYDYC